MLFWLTIILSTLQSFCDAKYALLWFLFGGGVRRFVRVAFSLVSMAASLCAANILFWKRNYLTSMAHIIKLYELHWETGKAITYFPITLALTTTFLAILRSFLHAKLEDLTTEKVVLQSSFLISEDIFLWSSDNLNITSQQLKNEYGSNVNTFTIWFAAAKIVRDFVYRCSLACCVTCF